MPVGTEDDVLELDISDAIDAPPIIGSDERRMHVRAYNHWVSLLDGRPFPSIEDIDPTRDADFGPHSVLLDFTGGSELPDIAFIGEALRIECGFVERPPGNVDAVPPRSLLSRLTDHYLQIIANRSPVGFEAEFINVQGTNTAYRGILMPFSSDGETIDCVFGVINWKEIAAIPELEALQAQFSEALAAGARRSTPDAWADDGEPDHAPAEEAAPCEDEALADWLAHARDGAERVKQAEGRTRAALYLALGRAYDFCLLSDSREEEYRELLTDAAIAIQARAPMTPIVKLVFGADYDKTRLTEFAAALSYARRHDLPRGAMQLFLERYPGGLKAVVAAERRERRPAERPARPDPTREAARTLTAQAVLSLPGEDEFVVLVARRVDAERVAVIGVAPDDRALVDRALRQVIAQD